ncbi:hypothetical protein [Salmonella enterica]|uniref:Uncharacterized protein n=1 Tax=Salmonella phage vB_Se_STGO-35-1 TaxID=2749381 RepID=A0A889INT0_9CAUD|nr:hypothetical protein [Salmonella enterica]YP_010054063.1 hypothetical protein KGB48_gp43 [Salmonella phage vB_Se_STGO-35-1]QRD99778.1 hypothetical protein JKL37_0042 [Salmonella phage vB_Se_STGO-35-1]
MNITEVIEVRWYLNTDYGSFEIPKWGKWVAVDEDGQVWAYGDKPEIMGKSWQTWTDDIKRIGDTHCKHKNFNELIFEVVRS